MGGERGQPVTWLLHSQIVFVKHVCLIITVNHKPNPNEAAKVWVFHQIKTTHYTNCKIKTKTKNTAKNLQNKNKNKTQTNNTKPTLKPKTLDKNRK